MVKISVNKIETVTDVRKFFEELVINDVIFHPDDDFKTYVVLSGDKDSGRPSFSKKEQVRLNKLMDDSFNICEKCGKDIYDLALSVVMESME